MATYNPHYLHKSLNFLSAHMDTYPYHELVDAEFPLAQAGEALEKSDRKEITRALAAAVAAAPRVEEGMKDALRTGMIFEQTITTTPEMGIVPSRAGRTAHVFHAGHDSVDGRHLRAVSHPLYGRGASRRSASTWMSGILRPPRSASG